MKTEERLRARELRAAGCSVKEIEQLLGVSRASVSVWVRDVQLSAEDRARLLERERRGPLISGERRSARARAVRLAWQERGRELVRAGDPHYAALCALYWAEGAKHRNVLKLTNSDPEMLAYFFSVLRRNFDVPDARARVACNLFADHLARQWEIEEVWLRCLGLPRACLRRSTVNAYSKYSQKKRRNRLPYGTCALVVHSTEIVQTIYGSIQELGGFTRSEWLDWRP